MSVVPVPMPTPLTPDNIEFIPGDGTLTINFKNQGAYDEYGLFYNDVKCNYADVYKYAPQLTTTNNHYVLSYKSIIFIYLKIYILLSKYI